VEVVIPDNARTWIEKVAGGRVVSVAALPGATSSSLHAVDVETADGETMSLVLRRFTNKDWVKKEPDIATREAKSVVHATEAGLPVPQLVGCDADGSKCGAPATLVTMVRGEVVLQPESWTEWLQGLAHVAARIHKVEAEGFRWKYRRYNDRAKLAVPKWSEQPEAWRRAIEVVQEPEPVYTECFVHRDFHPSNVLWWNGRVSGVVDWVNGCRGPAGIDVAWCRHNLASLHGLLAADEFLSQYSAAAGPAFEYHPYWDLMSVVELLPGPPSMYEGWRAGGVPEIDDALIRQRIDLYVASVVTRLSSFPSVSYSADPGSESSQPSTAQLSLR
jgi:aminoglycoside phosphotransferase (APT) family kinase protein